MNNGLTGAICDAMNTEYLWATRQSGDFRIVLGKPVVTCAMNGDGGVFGCGSGGAPAMCMLLRRGIGIDGGRPGPGGDPARDLCSDNTAGNWQCGISDADEANDVIKTRLKDGGVICCKD